MTETDSSEFIELENYWLSITRRDYFPRGFGKWMLYNKKPHRLYQILREELLAGALSDASSIKTRADRPAGEVGGVFIYTAPYTDQQRVLRLAEELRELDKGHQFRLVRPLLFITDLHNTWAETLSRPGDGYHELLKEKIPLPGRSMNSIAQAWVTDNEEGARYWVVARPHAYGQIRIQMWWERQRGEPYPDIFHEL